MALFCREKKKRNLQDDQKYSESYREESLNVFLQLLPVYMDTETLKMEKLKKDTYTKYTKLYQCTKLNSSKIRIFCTWNYIALTKEVLL